MGQNSQNPHKKDETIQTNQQNYTTDQIRPQILDFGNESSPIKTIISDSSRKQASELTKQYQNKIMLMSQTILKLNKKNEQQKQQFFIMNQKLNKAFSKLTPNKLKQPQKKSQQTVILGQQVQRVKKQLQNQTKKNKQLKKQVQLLKQTQKLFNNQNKFIQLMNQLVDKQRQIRQLKEKLKGYERAEFNQKKMTHYKKQQELGKKLNQLNEENIFLNKKVSQLKTIIDQIQKQKLIEKAEKAVQKNLKFQNKKISQSTQFIKKQMHEQEVKKYQNQLKIYQNQKASIQKSHKQQLQSLRRQNLILHQQIDELKNEIKRKKKENFILQHRNNLMQQMKKSPLDRNSLTIGLQVDKDQRYKTFSPILKAQNDIFGTLRKQFLGLSYGNYGNDYKKHDDSLKLDENKNYRVSSMIFTYFEQHILSLKTRYKYYNGQQIQLQTFQLQHSYSNFRSVQIIFQEHQYIKQMDIFCRKMIQFIQIRSSRNQTYQIGNQRSQIKCKKYSFDIKSHEKPVAFGCINQIKKINDIKKECLVVLGLIMKKKDISIVKKKLYQHPKNGLKQKPSKTERRKHSNVSIQELNQIIENNDQTYELQISTKK